MIWYFLLIQMIENTNAKNSVPHHFLNLAQFIINFRSAEFKVSYGWLTTDERLTHFIKAIYQILGRLKRSEYPSIKGPQSSEEGLVVREKVPSRTERPQVREPGTNDNHVTVCQSHNISYSENRQEIPASIDNMNLEWTEYQYVKNSRGKSLERNLHERNCDCDKKHSTVVPELGYMKWNSDTVVN